MEPNVWVVWGANGQYSDREEYVLAAFSTEALAAAWVARAQRVCGEARWKRAKLTTMNGSLPDHTLEYLRSTVGDPKGLLDTEYSVEALTIDALAVYLEHGSPGVGA